MDKMVRLLIYSPIKKKKKGGQILILIVLYFPAFLKKAFVLGL